MIAASMVTDELIEASEHFTDGELVLVGDERDDAIFLAAAAEHMTADRLQALHELGGGLVVLGLGDDAAERLAIDDGGRASRTELGLTVSIPFDAAHGVSGGWSMRDRAYTMRLAANRVASASDFTVPGHVHPAWVGARHSGAAAAAVELARVSELAEAVALGAVVDRHGHPVRLPDALERAELRRLSSVSSGVLHSVAVARSAEAETVSCRLPARDGAFRAVGHAADGSDHVTLALIHGDLAAVTTPLVHVHVACQAGDTFGSRLCRCREELDAATAAVVAAGAGAILYLRSAEASPWSCARDAPVDLAPAVGLLRAERVEAIRLTSGSAPVAAELAGFGLTLS